MLFGFAHIKKKENKFVFHTYLRKKAHIFARMNHLKEEGGSDI
jgi:hypothetical protein